MRLDLIFYFWVFVPFRVLEAITDDHFVTRENALIYSWLQKVNTFSFEEIDLAMRSCEPGKTVEYNFKIMNCVFVYIVHPSTATHIQFTTHLISPIFNIFIHSCQKQIISFSCMRIQIPSANTMRHILDFIIENPYEYTAIRFWHFHTHTERQSHAYIDCDAAVASSIHCNTFNATVKVTFQYSVDGICWTNQTKPHIFCMQSMLLGTSQKEREILIHIVAWSKNNLQSHSVSCCVSVVVVVFVDKKLEKKEVFLFGFAFFLLFWFGIIYWSHNELTNSDTVSDLAW